MSDDFRDTTPLGRSVEEIEAETQNRANSPTPGEERRDAGGVSLAVPATTVAGLGGGSGALVGAVLATDGETAAEDPGIPLASRTDEPTDNSQT